MTGFHLAPVPVSWVPVSHADEPDPAYSIYTGGNIHFEFTSTLVPGANIGQETIVIDGSVPIQVMVYLRADGEHYEDVWLDLVDTLTGNVMASTYGRRDWFINHVFAGQSCQIVVKFRDPASSVPTVSYSDSRRIIAALDMDAPMLATVSLALVPRQNDLSTGISKDDADSIVKEAVEEVNDEFEICRLERAKMAAMLFRQEAEIKKLKASVKALEKS